MGWKNHGLKDYNRAERVWVGPTLRNNYTTENAKAKSELAIQHNMTSRKTYGGMGYLKFVNCKRERHINYSVHLNKKSKVLEEKDLSYNYLRVCERHVNFENLCIKSLKNVFYVKLNEKCARISWKTNITVDRKTF